MANLFSRASGYRGLLRAAKPLKFASFWTDNLALLIPQDVALAMGKAGIAAAPREACGLLFGNLTQENSWVSQFIAVPNRKRSLNNFGISRPDFEAAAEVATYPLIGVFHSHLQGLELSDNDRQGLRNSRLIWVVLSVSNLQLKAFSFSSTNQRIDELGVEFLCS